jgi:hypothetical protein
MMARWGNYINARTYILLLTLLSLVACATSSIPDNYHDPDMDFAALRTIAVMPFGNLTRDKQAGARVRDTFMTALLSTGVVYVPPPGEVARGISKIGVTNPTAPSEEEIAKLTVIIVVREYGAVRSGTTSANVISLSLQMIEKESKKVVWTASSTKGGISIWDRLFGGGGRPMNEITEAAIDDIINKLLY